MADLTHIENLVERAKARLIGLFKGKPHVEDLVDVLVSQIQIAEDTAWSLVVERTLDQATGVNLDQYGTLLDEPRNGLEDDDYRRVLRARVAADDSDGEGDVILDVVSRLTDSDNVRLTEAYPHTIMVSVVVDAPLTDDARERTARMTQSAVMAGVNLCGLVEGVRPYFGFDDDPEASGFDVGIWAECMED